MDLFDKLKILSDAAKYDVACTSSGVDRKAQKGQIGSAVSCGICHSFAGDGRCISLLKVLMTNACIYDCKYCVNRRSNDTPRAGFTPRELAELTIQFYRRNYIEGLFLSSGVQKNPDYTCEQMIEAIRLLREEHHFAGYIHAKAIPGADAKLLQQLGMLADRMSVNIELPSQQSLKLLAPDKSKQSIFTPMGFIRNQLRENASDLVKYHHAPKFAPAGQSTQMIIGATGESDYTLLQTTQALYQGFDLKRVFYSAYIPLNEDALLPAIGTLPPLLREHRLYQADWLLRYYGFHASELLTPDRPNFNLALDPKCDWALRHLEQFPVEVACADYSTLMRVPGIGAKSALRILKARRLGPLSFDSIRKMGVVLKRAQYFITCNGKMHVPIRLNESFITRQLTATDAKANYMIAASGEIYEQLSLF